MKSIIATAAALSFLTFSSPGEAGAYISFYGGYGGYNSFGGNHGPVFSFGRYGYGKQPRYLLPPSAIIRALRAQEFCYISRPRFRRGLYRARARDAYGRRVRLAIDPYSGEIIGLRYRY